ncbi:unnamed protein product [Effrenium voratum]|nr:unnamed protein product [Effrenium voratum]
MEISATGAAKSMMRRQAEEESGVDNGGDVRLAADAAQYDARFHGSNGKVRLNKNIAKNDCTGLTQATACSETDVSATAAACESHKAAKGAAFYRCSWKPSEPNHGDEPAVPAECFLDEKVGPCSRVGDSSAPKE